MGNDVYAYRAAWVAGLARHFGGLEKFAALVNKNPKHMSAIKGGKKRMGSQVARDIETALMQIKDTPKDWRTGMLDTDPALNNSPSAGVHNQISASASQTQRPPAFTLALQLAAEAMEGRTPLPPANYNELVLLLTDVLDTDLPQAQVLQFTRRMVRVFTGENDGSQDSAHKGASG